ncbi:hypothetical protein RFI_15125, partial [Reticulomyxa filosa]
ITTIITAKTTIKSLCCLGGYFKHTLVMKYASVWSDKLNELNNYNKCVAFTDHNNHPIIAGRYSDDYWIVRAVINGSNNHLLFITYSRINISVFNLNTFKFIKHDTLPANYIGYHCFVNYKQLFSQNKSKTRITKKKTIVVNKELL